MKMQFLVTCDVPKSTTYYKDTTVEDQAKFILKTLEREDKSEYYLGGQTKYQVKPVPNNVDENDLLMVSQLKNESQEEREIRHLAEEERHEEVNARMAGEYWEDYYEDELDE